MSQNPNMKRYIPDGSEIRKEGNMTAWPVAVGDIGKICRNLYFSHHLPLQTITAADDRNEAGGFRIFYVFGVPDEHAFLAPYIAMKDHETFPSITRAIHEASGYERKIRTFFGLTPDGHPHLRPMLLHENWPGDVYPLRKDFPWGQRPATACGEYPFQRVEGEGIYEIPVGPVHAGIIEPGHFRFSVAGEEIVLLEPKLGYKHKGVEKLFEILPMEEKVRLAERVSGDTSFTHSLAFCQATECLSAIEVPERAKYLRVIYSELERLANHLNDIGFIMLDTGYGFGGSNGARLREVVMQWNERLTGSRFLRGVNAIGGVTRDIPGETAAELQCALKALHRDFDEVIRIAGSSNSLRNRLSGTGKLDRQIALDHGVIGVAGRAVGIGHDTRIEYPYAAYDQIPFAVASEQEGDVWARWSVRIREVLSSLSIIERALQNMPADQKIGSDQAVKLKKNSFSIGATEGWRGGIVYFMMTDSAGRVSRVDVRDPSFLNWTVVGHASKGNVVPDFPLINKSFNLSYSGNDL
jgi:Ni,Fe-hydrogenase III large subunit/Ni,Fe-hydrogenase III component G